MGSLAVSMLPLQSPTRITTRYISDDEIERWVLPTARVKTWFRRTYSHWTFLLSGEEAERVWRRVWETRSSKMGLSMGR